MLNQIFNQYKSNLLKNKKMKQQTWKKIEEKLPEEYKVEKKQIWVGWKIMLLTFIVLIVSTISLSSYYGYKIFRKIKYPVETVTSNAKELKKFDSCESMQKQIQASIEKEKNNSNVIFDKLIDISTPAMKQNYAEENSSASYYTNTNIQVSGIDESDSVKTNGSLIIKINKTKSNIEVYKAFPFDEARKTSEIDVQNASELMLFEEKLIVISSSYRILSEKKNYNSNIVTVTLYDLSNPEKPFELKKYDIEGTFLTSRLKEGYFYLISNKYTYNYDYKNEDTEIVPSYRDSTITENGNFVKTCKCTDIAILDEENVVPSFTTISTINLKEKSLSIDFTNFIGNAKTVYMGNENIYLVSSRYERIAQDIPIVDRFVPNYRETTLINKVKYEKSNLSFVASVSFDGKLLNQFSLDEKDSYLRVAGTKGEIWNGSSTSFLSIFDKDLKQQSTIDNLAKGEAIYSVRFYGSTAVVVTFKKIDPLFVFDLKDPKNPKLKGALKIPGYSDYLHFLDENTVIGLGKEAVEATVDEKDQRQLDFAWHQGIKLAIFDISDMTNPKELSKLVLGERGSESEALRNHKAFVLDMKHNLIIFPALETKVDKSKCNQNYYGDINSCYGDPVWQGAEIISFADKKLSLKGQISHFEGSYPTNYSSNPQYITRAIVLEDTIFTLSDTKVMLNKIETLEKIKEI